MMLKLEVCIDNIESLFTAQKAGADRIELCSALALGGLTPSFALMKSAVQYSTIPVYAMIRPRDGDFLYSSHEIEMMLAEIYNARAAGVHGLVFGILNKQAQVDADVLKSLMHAAAGIGVTFHRAIDCSVDIGDGVDKILTAGCERILTSGLMPNAIDGISNIKKMVELSEGHLSVMAGSGINPANVQKIIKQTGIKEVHLSGKAPRKSHMQEVVCCGELAEFQQVSVTQESKIRAIKELLNTA
ncbi:MAG: copper homeostasis protein CutC [Psychromonas sp.]